jgi:hypothetical protein
VATDRPPPGEPGVEPGVEPGEPGLPPRAPSPPEPSTPPPRPVRYTGFIVTGLVIGLVAAVLVWVFGSGDPRYPAAAVLGYLAALGGLVGAVLGGTVGVVIETVTTRRYRRRVTRGR